MPPDSRRCFPVHLFIGNVLTPLPSVSCVTAAQRTEVNRGGVRLPGAPWSTRSWLLEPRAVGPRVVGWDWGAVFKILLEHSLDGKESVFQLEWGEKGSPDKEHVCGGEEVKEMDSEPRVVSMERFMPFVCVCREVGSVVHAGGRQQVARGLQKPGDPNVEEDVIPGSWT